MVTVDPIDARTFRVTVSRRSTTTHAVTVSPEYHQRLTRGKVPPHELVRRSFEFLLEREDNTSILPRFDLSVIGQYFPEYERTLAASIGGAGTG